MLVTATTQVMRSMGDLIRRADRGLALGAARNAAAAVAVRQGRRLEDARTMRDVRRLEPQPDTTPAATEARVPIGPA